MQLAYIWVAKFRNLRYQGFNLSSKFSIDFEPISAHLNIRANRDYLPDFFYHKVQDVTAIVGENATGKSNLLELINRMLDGGNTRIDGSFFMVFEHHGRFTVHEQEMDIDHHVENYHVDFERYDSEKIPVHGVFFTNTFDGRRYNFGHRIHNLSTNRLYQNDYGELSLGRAKMDIMHQLAFLNSPLIGLQLDSSANLSQIMPSFVLLVSPTWNSLRGKCRAFDQKISRSNRNSNGPSLNEFCRIYRKKITDNQSSRSLIYFTAFLLFLDFMTNDFFTEQRYGIQHDLDVRNDPSGIIDRLSEINLDYLNNARINEIHEILTTDIAQHISQMYPGSRDKGRFLREMGRREFQGVDKNNEGTYSGRTIQFEAPFISEIRTFIDGYLRCTPDTGLGFSIDWGGISSGQKAFLNLYSRLYSVREAVSHRDIVLTIDEGDLYFHPRWQREYLLHLLNMLPEIFEGKIQLILTTHSPFLVSDLTRNHLIYLENNNGRCKVVPKDEMGLATFGGNLGELYLNAFFLRGALVSSFAALRITELINKAKETPKTWTKEDTIILAQIGDQMIKAELKRLLNDQN